MPRQPKEEPEMIYKVIATILMVGIIIGVIWGIVALFSGGKHTPTSTTHVQAPKPSTHKVVYTFSLTKGTLSATDQGDVGIGWHNPITNTSSGPTNIDSAIQQIASGSYSVSYDVAKVNDNNLEAGVNNYTDPDATVSCTITIDGKVIATEQAPPSGGSQCSGIASDSGSFSN